MTADEQLRASAQRRLDYAQEMLADAIRGLTLRDCEGATLGMVNAAAESEEVDNLIRDAVQNALNALRGNVSCYLDAPED